ncbi:pentapeptide repeat-containing protein, partial [Halolamina salina]
MRGDCSYTFDPDSGSRSADRDSSLTEPWSCPHEAHDDSEYCVVHMSPEARDDLGIDDRAVAAAVERAAEAEGREGKQLIGGNFEDLDLSYLVLETGDQFPLDLRHATVAGTLSLATAELRQPLDLRHASIGDVAFEEAVFREFVDISDAEIDGEFDAAHATFVGDVDLIGTRFRGPVSLEEGRFHGDTCLRFTEYEAAAVFDGVEFRGDANLLDDDACLEDAVFHERASFRKAEFRYADFVGATFEAVADFDEATFTGDGEFRETRFEGDASFRGAEFRGDMNVEIDDADFSGPAFGGDADFTNGQFALANFAGATFAGETLFTEAAFEEDADFRGTTFESALDLTEARFREDADLSGVSVGG